MSRLNWQPSKFIKGALVADYLWTDNSEWTNVHIRTISYKGQDWLLCYEYNIKMSVDRLEEMKYYIEYIHLADLQVKYEQLKLILGERNE